jgi:hypothetical protein
MSAAFAGTEAIQAAHVAISAVRPMSLIMPYLLLGSSLNRIGTGPAGQRDAREQLIL